MSHLNRNIGVLNVHAEPVAQFKIPLDQVNRIGRSLFDPRSHPHSHSDQSVVPTSCRDNVLQPDPRSHVLVNTSNGQMPRNIFGHLDKVFPANDILRGIHLFYRVLRSLMKAVR